MLEDSVKFYKHGMHGIIPKEWERYVKEATNSEDPEFREYQRLKKKFES